MELYKDDGGKAGLYDVCEWWIEKYPSDIFIDEPVDVIKARRCMQNILKKGNCKQTINFRLLAQKTK